MARFGLGAIDCCPCHNKYPIHLVAHGLALLGFSFVMNLTSSFILYPFIYFTFSGFLFDLIYTQQSKWDRRLFMKLKFIEVFVNKGGRRERN